jgi:hypothetical protein
VGAVAESCGGGEKAESLMGVLRLFLYYVVWKSAILTFPAWSDGSDRNNNARNPSPVGS